MAGAPDLTRGDGPYAAVADRAAFWPALSAWSGAIARVPLSSPARPRGGDRGRQGWRTGTARAAAAAPLPLSYTRIGIAVQLPAGWCPSLRTRIAGAVTDLTGIVPATASVPVRHQLMGWGQAVISAHTNPASSRATAVAASAGAFPRPVRARYLAYSRRCAFQDRARVFDGAQDSYGGGGEAALGMPMRV